MNMLGVMGIGTGVGKTIVSAILLEAFRGEYWKPIQCGLCDPTDTDRIKTLVTPKDACRHPEAFRLQAPLSPHHAARLEGLEISTKKITPPKTGKTLIIEGCGGLLVPINNETLIIDLLKDWNIPCILVSKHYLGSINHTLLSLEALKRREIDVRGIVFNGPPNKDSEQIIENMSKCRILGRLDWHSQINKTLIKKYAQLWKNSLITLFH